MEGIPPARVASKLPSFRSADLFTGLNFITGHQVSLHGHLESLATRTNNLPQEQEQEQEQDKMASSFQVAANKASTHKSPPHHRTQSGTVSSGSPKRQRLPRPLSFPLAPDSPQALESAAYTNIHPNLNAEIILPSQPNSLTRASTVGAKPQKARIPASHSRNDLLEESRKEGRNTRRPPAAMITQGSYKIDTTATSTSTSTWVASQAQQTITIPSPPQNSQPLPSPAPTSARSTDTTGSRPLIKPIRGFKPSNRKSTEMALRRTSTNDDNTLRALEGYEPNRRISDPSDPDEPNSDESDMFLRAAREEEMSRQASNGPVEAVSRSESRRSRIGQRSSLPPNTSYSSPISRRRGSDQESNVSRPMEEQGNVGQVLTYRPSEKDRAPSALDDINKNRFYASNTRSNPTTPRGPGNREISPESLPYNGRRGSLPDPTSVLPQRSSYRQSNLSYSTPRNYNSSPLVSRSTEVQDAPIPETPRAAEGTESSVSTTAPSTVWDELEDLKSRIHRLELTGKLPATSGAAISRASNDRPPTATTTVTTMSTSPRQRGRGNSVSPIEAEQPNEVHPLLHAAIAKSKPLLSAEIYKALEATASDALTIASMMGTSGQPGPISSSQSTVGGFGVSDRQVRRKADSMCRSLTELCLALSDEANERGQSIAKETANRPRSRDTELHITTEQSPLPRQPISTDLARVKASPRALSRLEARRSSLLNTSTLPSPRYAPSEVGTPTQASMAGRRTSLFLRSRRGNTEEPEEDDDTRFRAPSRATTEIGRFRNSQKEYVQEPMPERTLTVQSSLPVRRHVASSSFPSTAAAPVAPPSNLGGRKYLDRSTPERDSNTVVGRLMEDRGQRKPSIGGGFGLSRTGSLTRRSRQPGTAETSSAGQGSYQ